MRVITYIDGFNLYHSIKDLGSNREYLKWQNINKLSTRFLSRNDEIIKIKFFTAYPKWKSQSYIRHKNYVAILQDLRVEVIMGHFKLKRVFCHNCKQEIKKHEEKQTDVNIATHIINDMYQDKPPDIIQLISGDTDLIPPLKIAQEKGIKIHIVIPYGRKANEYDFVDKKSKIKIKHLQKSILPQAYTTSSNQVLSCPYTYPTK
ncbi:NYN domain-containing protein [Helicobacter bilis]|uniref:NYN domain-containing protein n=1 Tax=Helicobacter bilis TaxID=37372 RepID=A0A4U8U811_9HELI|nr:NYN domain-containing protein [Helicobacter bilis]MCI7411336.1 NYN domain-containing protein [Helicobacter bilis]MDD7295853.1 NYN domain-containing protein [Helicobacter bilis]MDY4400619.1 NYN domain-containing protein [Helicobacter bilis]TLE08440.1 NYN domain-containing protein [Helicobacter bilis]